MSAEPTLPVRPRWFAPEVIQTSAMDCGPAALKCLLDGCGLPVHYGRLREACQTGLDGTSIDTLEDLANALGLVATQTLVPVDHVGLRAEGRTPALTIVNLPGGRGTHFVVVWAGYGHLVQVMDPSSGRRFRPAHALRSQLYVHAHQAAPETWRAFASSASFLAPFEERLRALSIARAGRRELLRGAQQDDEASGLAALDAATRLVTTLVASRHLAGGRRAQALVHTLAERVRAEPARALQTIPPRFWFARPEGPHAFLMRGAVLVQAQGLRVSAQAARPRSAAPASAPGLTELLTAAPSHPLGTVHRLLREEGAFPQLALAAIVATSSAALLAESALLRGLVDLGQRLGTPAARAGGVAAFACFLLALFALVAGATRLSLRLGRRLEARLRMVYFAKLPRLGDRYFQSRLVADMAERGHMLMLLRRLPELAVATLRGSIDVALYAVGLVWLDPSSAWLVALTALFAGCAPFLLQPLLGEAEMRVRGQQAALGRFYLDALLGLVPLRMHAAERALAREQEGVLDEWFGAGLRLQALSVGADGLVALGTTALSGLLVLHHLTRDGSLGAALLVVYWSLQLPAQAAATALALRQYPAFRNVLLRMLELADAPEEVSAEPTPPAPARGRGMALALEGASVVASGQTVLSELDLQVAPGEHVAIVGRSGAGKSSLVGLFLGWQRPLAGRVLVDGQPLDGARLASVRREVAWVDPAVQLWNDSLLANVQYGAAPPAPDELARLLEESELARVVERLPEGLGSGVGEGGGMLSGGEGQRVRLCRGLLRPEARLVVLDEALRGLARGQRALLLARVRARAEGATLLCVTHDLAETVSFPRVLVVEDGRIIEDGAPRVLLARAESRYAQLLRGDERAQERVWRAPFWRRWQVAGGRLAEER